MATKDEILTIKQHADITALVGEYVSLKKAGKNWLGLCPFHQERTPSFTVSPDLGIFKCFGCGRSGDVISFVQEADHLTFGEAVEKLAVRTGVELSKGKDRSPEYAIQQKVMQINTQVATLWQYFLWKHPLGEPALAYLREKRHFSDDTIKRFGIGFAPKAGSVLLDALTKKGFNKEELISFGLLVEASRGIRDKFINRIMFPVYNTSGQVIAFSGRVFEQGDERPKYLNSPETVAFKKRYNLFGLSHAKESIRKKDAAILVEGQTDVIASAQAGVPHIVAPLGTGLTPDQLQLLGRYSKNILFATDNDQAGFKSALRGAVDAARIGAKVFILQLPEEFHDVDEMIKQDRSRWISLADHPVEWLKAAIEWYRDDRPAHIQPVLGSQEAVLRHIVDFIKALSDPVAQQVAKQTVQDALSISPSSMEPLFGAAASPAQVAPEEPNHESYLGLEEHLVHSVLAHPELSSTFPQVIPFISEKWHQRLVQELLYWQEADPAGAWSQISKKPGDVTFKELIQHLTTHFAQIGQLVQEYGLVHNIKEVTPSEYALMCKRLMKERSQFLVSFFRKKMSAAESINDPVEIKRLTKKITQLQSFLK